MMVMDRLTSPPLLLPTSLAILQENDLYLEDALAFDGDSTFR